MGIIKKQGILNTIIAYLGVLIAMFSILWLQPKLLTPAEIGLLGVLVDAGSLFMPFVLMGVTAIFLRFYPTYKQHPHPHAAPTFVTLMFLLPLVGLISVFGFLWLFRDKMVAQFAEKSPDFVHYFGGVIYMCAFLVYYSVLEAFGRVKQRTVATVFIKDVGVRLGTIVLVLLYAHHFLNKDGLVFAYIALFGLSVLILALYFRQQDMLRFGKAFEIFNRTNTRQIARFGVFIFLGTMSSMIVGKIDSMMVAKYLGLEENGVYRIAFFIGVVIEMPRRALSQIAGPMVAEKISLGEWQWIENLYQRIATNQTLVGAGILLLIWCNIDSLFQLMPNGSVYSSGKYVVLFIGLSKLFDMMTSINEDIIAYSSYYHYALGVMLGLIGLTFLTNYYLIPLYGITGSALATALSVWVYNAAKYAIIWWKFKIQPFTPAILKVGVLAMVVLLVDAYFPTLSSPFADLCIRSMLIGVLLLVGTWIGNISPDILNLIPLKRLS